MTTALTSASATGGAVAVGLAAVDIVYQIRRFRGTAALAPQLYEGPSPDLPGWPTA